MKWIKNLFSDKQKTDNVEINNVQNTEIITKERHLTQADIERIIYNVAREGINIDDDFDLSNIDPLFEEAARLIVAHQQGSISLIQRKFSIGYNRTGRIMDQLELAGIVGPTQGSKPRDVYVLDEYQLKQKLRSGNYICQSYTIKQTEDVKCKYSVEIEVKRKELEKEIELRKEQKILEDLELEKQLIREELLAEERKKQLRRLVKKELIDSGHIQREAKRTQIPQDIQDRVWVRDGGKCVVCGSNENLEFDHIIPFSKGGSNTYRNIQLLCERCNREKSNKIG